MHCQQNPSRHLEALLDRSVPYEMIHDFGVGAFNQVVGRYQSNMADKLSEIKNCASQENAGEVLWGLQFVRNCPAQLGILAVVAVCSEFADDVVKRGASTIDHGRLEETLDLAVDALHRLIADS